MALNPRELFDSETRSAFPRTIAERVAVKEFGQGSGTLSVMAPLAFNTSTNKWVPFEVSGSNGTGTIKGFVWPDEIVLDSDEEVLGQVLLRGILHEDDVLAATTEADGGTRTALRSGPRGLGLDVQGLTQVR